MFGIEKFGGGEQPPQDQELEAEVIPESAADAEEVGGFDAEAFFERMEMPDIAVSQALLDLDDPKIEEILDDAEVVNKLTPETQEVVTRLRRGIFTRPGRALFAALVAVSSIGAPKAEAGILGDIGRAVGEEAVREGGRKVDNKYEWLFEGINKGARDWQRENERRRREAERDAEREAEMEERYRERAERDAQENAERRQEIEEDIKAAQKKIDEYRADLVLLEQEAVKNKSEEETKLEGRIKELLGQLAIYSPQIAVEVKLEDINALRREFNNKTDSNGELSPADQAEYEKRIAEIELVAEVRADSYTEILEAATNATSELDAKRAMQRKARDIERDLRSARSDLERQQRNNGDSSKIQDLRREIERLQDDIDDWKDDVRKLR